MIQKSHLIDSENGIPPAFGQSMMPLAPPEKSPLYVQ
jgi:hypothetical protein